MSTLRDEAEKWEGHVRGYNDLANDKETPEARRVFARQVAKYAGRRADQLGFLADMNEDYLDRMDEERESRRPKTPEQRKAQRERRKIRRRRNKRRR